MPRPLIDKFTIVKGCTVYVGENGKFDSIPLCEDVEVGLPEISFPTIESQSMGPIECVDQTRVNAMQLTISCEPSIIQSRIHGYGIKDYMIKWGQEYKKGDGTGFALMAFVAYAKGIPVSESGESVNPGNNTTGTVTINTTYYRLVQNGKVIRYIDKLKGVLEINGIDYRAELEKML